MKARQELVFVLKSTPHQPFQAAGVRFFGFGQVTLPTAALSDLERLSLAQVMALASVCDLLPDGRPIFYAASHISLHAVAEEAEP